MKLFSKLFATIVIAMGLVTSASAVDAAKVHKKRVTPQGLYLTAKEAASYIKKHQKEMLFVDIRTQAEVEYVGNAKLMDVNIPWHFKDFSKWDSKKHRFADKPMNKNFVADIQKALESKGLNKDSKIALICRSGSRSTKAAKLLSENGYNNVYNIVDGFEGGKSKKTKHRSVNGWKNKAPKNSWGYKLDKAKMYGVN